MDARQHMEAAAKMTEPERPAMARALRDLIDQLGHPESPHAITPREAFQHVAVEADTLMEEIETTRHRAGLL